MRPAVREINTTEMATGRSKGIWWEPTFKPNSRPQSPSKSKDKSFSNQHSSAKHHHRTSTPKDTRTCHNCDRTGYLAKDCTTNEYFVKMYKELQQLKSQQREARTLDAPSLEGTNLENYMASLPGFDMCSGIIESDIVKRESLLTYSNHHDVALLESATTHMIL